MIDWIVTYPIQAGFIGLGVALVYFTLLAKLEKKLKERDEQGVS